MGHSKIVVMQVKFRLFQDDSCTGRVVLGGWVVVVTEFRLFQKYLLVSGEPRVKLRPGDDKGSKRAQTPFLPVVLVSPNCLLLISHTVIVTHMKHITHLRQGTVQHNMHQSKKCVKDTPRKETKEENTLLTHTLFFNDNLLETEEKQCIYSPATMCERHTSSRDGESNSLCPKLYVAETNLSWGRRKHNRPLPQSP
ncbi:hypothetical protein CHS0354_031588 [Potamilus streckersoni]|uniref:Uncharacterized protein n=1 Tax=Potamilus streckersoni TaxID=2493646 RepID=A0AAE0VW85_9BIVA|nr:hypothetical protein CHS0354_031588 [Potamilus streckersoni]